jgi:DNA-binding transcriptional ArsR family regulator
VFIYEWQGVVRRLALPRGVKLVAATLAQYANPDGTRVRPGRERLAEESGYSPRQVDRHLKTLRDLGLIVRVRSGSANGRRKLSDEYRLVIPEDILERVDLVRHIDLGPVDEPENSGHQMSTDSEDDDDDDWSPMSTDFDGSLDAGDVITGHDHVHPPSHDHARTTSTPDDHSLQDDHSRREASPVDNVYPFRHRRTA